MYERMLDTDLDKEEDRAGHENTPSEELLRHEGTDLIQFLFLDHCQILLATLNKYFDFIKNY